jgi:3-carboxy-cis,cis-muconate cycloisomerase
MVQEHERALGGWQAEWDTLPEIAQLAAGALRQVRDVVAGLQVDTARMRANLDATHGQIMAEAVTLALGAGIGRMAAHQLVERACRAAADSGRHLREVLKQDADVNAQLGAEEIDRLLDPAGYTGAADEFIDRVLHEYRTQSEASSETP